MNIDNTYELQRIFSQIINESEGLAQQSVITDSDTNSDTVTLPNNRDELTKAMLGEKFNVPNYDKLNDNTKVLIIEKISISDSIVTAVANITTYHGRIYLNDGRDYYSLKNNHEINTRISHEEDVKSVYSESISYGELKKQVKNFIDQLDFKDEGYRFLTKGGHILHGVIVDKIQYQDDYCLFLTWDTNTCPSVKRKNNKYKKVKMSDGNTIIYVNPDDVYDAKKDGFHIVSEGGKKGLTTKINEMTDDEINAGAGMIRLLKTVKKTLPNYGRYYIEGGKLCINIGKVNSNITQKVNDIVRSFLRMCPKETTSRGKLIKLPEVQYAGESWLWNNQVIVMFAPIQTIKKEDAAREHNMQQADELDTSDIDSYSSDN